MTPRHLVLVFLALLAVAPLALPPFYVTLLNYIGLYAMVALGLVLDVYKRQGPGSGSCRPRRLPSGRGGGCCG